MATTHTLLETNASTGSEPTLIAKPTIGHGKTSDDAFFAEMHSLMHKRVVRPPVGARVKHSNVSYNLMVSYYCLRGPCFSFCLQTS